MQLNFGTVCLDFSSGSGGGGNFGHHILTNNLSLIWQMPNEVFNLPYNTKCQWWFMSLFTFDTYAGSDNHQDVVLG
jgi:hypothetical protein